jgi:hypothetical protein
MKSLGKFTIRGSGVSAEVKRLLLFDGEFSTAYKIQKFVITPKDPASSAELTCKLITINSPHSVYWNFQINTELAWAAWNIPISSRFGQYELIDRDNLVVEDLYIDFSGPSSTDINYYIELEKFDVGLNVGAYTMVRNSSQDFPL